MRVEVARHSESPPQSSQQLGFGDRSPAVNLSRTQCRQTCAFKKDFENRE